MATTPRQRHWGEVNRPDITDTQVRVYVWEMPVRVSHWLTVACIAVLSFTGYYIHDPFIIARGRTDYLMGTMRFIHLITGFVFIASFILRAYWFFRGNEWAHWSNFIPVRRRRWDGMGAMVRYYSFLSKDLAHHVGHNALAGVTYTIVFLLMLWEILSGLAMYSNIVGSRTLGLLIGWLPRVIDIQYLRLSHFLIMFAFFVFVIHHVYSAVLVSWEERNGLIESIFTAYKFVPESELEADQREAEAEGRKKKSAAAVPGT